MKPKRIIYVQYTNPAAYPPLVHSSHMLAALGWDVLFLGTGSLGAGALRFRKTDGIRIQQLPFQRPGWRQKLHFLYFNMWCCLRVLKEQPDWIYCSDLFSCPFGWLMSFLGFNVIYHEHDSPDPKAAGAFERFLLRARAACARRARLCVIPNAQRGESLRESCAIDKTPEVVWNCPRLGEVVLPREAIEPGTLRLLYHGSIVPQRLPMTVIDALGEFGGRISLTVAGYETTGSRGYVDRLRTRASRLGVPFRSLQLPTREELMAVCREHDAGFALMPITTADLNLRTMEGASNKPFDYLACGLALIVSRRPEWEAMFVRPGYAYACDPGSADDVAVVLRKLLENPSRTRAMGEAGRQQILSDWNYEFQFQPVLDVLEGRLPQTRVASDPARAAEVRS